jgi:hypothetical protein
VLDLAEAELPEITSSPPSVVVEKLRAVYISAVVDWKTHDVDSRADDEQ